MGLPYAGSAPDWMCAERRPNVSIPCCPLSPLLSQAGPALRRQRHRLRVNLPRRRADERRRGGQLARRAKMGSGEVPMDWGFAEAISIGSDRKSVV